MKNHKLKVIKLNQQLGEDDDGTIPNYLQDDTGESEINHTIESNGKGKPKNTGRKKYTRKTHN